MLGIAVLLTLTGAALIERTIGGAGRAPVLETVSNALIAFVGAWLLFRAIRPHVHRPKASGPALAVFAGLVPCPLTTFVMAFSVSNGVVAGGLAFAAAFALGMVATVVLFPLAAILARSGVRPVVEGWGAFGGWRGRGLSVCSGLAVLALGVPPFVTA